MGGDGQGPPHIGAPALLFAAGACTLNREVSAGRGISRLDAAGRRYPGTTGSPCQAWKRTRQPSRPACSCSAASACLARLTTPSRWPQVARHPGLSCARARLHRHARTSLGIAVERPRARAGARKPAPVHQGTALTAHGRAGGPRQRAKHSPSIAAPWRWTCTRSAARPRSAPLPRCPISWSRWVATCLRTSWTSLRPPRPSCARSIGSTRPMRRWCA